MAQAGLHAIVGTVARKWLPYREWLFLGVVIGNVFPDLDNLAVAYATLTGANSHGLHRTFTHSIFTILATLIGFYLVARLTRDGRWNNFGIGFGAGILMHILLDLLLWFNGVELFWPIRYKLDFWSWFTVPGWLSVLLETGELLMFSLYFLFLGSLARRQNTDREEWAGLRMWMYVELALFVLFSILFFSRGAEGLLYTVFGALYLVSAILAIVLTIRMRRTVETIPA